MTQKKTILISNDDGISSRGIRSLVEVAKQFGKVYVVAPNGPQSAQGHSITIEHYLRIYPSDIFGEEVTAFACSGTPVDCIKMAKHLVMKEQKIDLCLSGINHGSNASTNIIYSGTMAAAKEAAMEGIPSIGFSLLDYAADADFEPAQHYMKKIIAEVLDNGMGEANLLNVNFPKGPLENIKGMRICRQAKGYWAEEFVEREDTIGRPYYWLTGKYVYEDEGAESDIWALENGYISIVPVTYDLTDHKAIASLSKLEKL